MAKRFSGMYAALMTGMDEAGEFSPDRQRNIDAYVLRQGLAGLYVGGSSGESGLLGTDELMAQQAVVAESARGHDARLIAHVGVPSLRDSVALARRAEALGYHALSALPPHAYPFSDEEVLAYYRELSAATALPLIVYEVPIRTGRPFGLDTLVELLEMPGVGGIKFTSTDLFKFSMLRRRCPESLFFFGFDEIYITGAALGADGGIGTTYNILGRLYAALDAAMRAGDLARAQELQDLSQRFVEALLEIGVLPGMKAAFRAIGVECGPTRAPLTPKIAEAEAHMKALLDRAEFKRWLA
ncbi:dihydrodipicolinate synthase family protein [Limimaricola cinnabarinus]|uniref:dihydrodipicolinate synthase family protein n=1 Tax=Limimaricola cinnabarinus TaxID=1125964 RepID=UPI002492DBC5|nr:dihydrodipicolinate synthase family protein [Limimaricola cinnabarinus]